MTYHNMTITELAREAEHTNNILALSLADKMEALLKEREDALEEERNEYREELVATFTSRVEEELEEYNRDNLKPDSDYCTSVAELLDHEITAGNVRSALEEADEDGKELETVLALLALDDGALDQLAEDMTSDTTALDVVVGTNYRAVPYTVAGTLVGEDCVELEHWLDDVPESIVPEVRERLTGSEDGELYYFDNSDTSVNLTLNFDWLSAWLEEYQENEAA